jgi:hypothetical protein
MIRAQRARPNAFLATVSNRDCIFRNALSFFTLLILVRTQAVDFVLGVSAHVSLLYLMNKLGMEDDVAALLLQVIILLE